MIHVSTEIGPYAEYSPAQERAMREQRDGMRCVRIDKTSTGWMIRGVKPAAKDSDG